MLSRVFKVNQVSPDGQGKTTGEPYDLTIGGWAMANSGLVKYDDSSITQAIISESGAVGY